MRAHGTVAAEVSLGQNAVGVAEALADDRPLLREQDLDAAAVDAARLLDDRVVGERQTARAPAGSRVTLGIEEVRRRGALQDAWRRGPGAIGDLAAGSDMPSEAAASGTA